MVYVIAKDKNKHGCYAVRVPLGDYSVKLKNKLNPIVAPKGIQLVTITRPQAYGEYAPYTLVENEDEFMRLVLAM